MSKKIRSVGLSICGRNHRLHDHDWRPFSPTMSLLSFKTRTKLLLDRSTLKSNILKIHYICLQKENSLYFFIYFSSLFSFTFPLLCDTQCANEFVCTASDSKPNEIMFWLDLMLLPLVCSIWGDDSGLALGTRSVARWMHPPQGRLKLNCDASVSLKFFCFHCQEVWVAFIIFWKT